MKKLLFLLIFFYTSSLVADERNIQLNTLFNDLKINNNVPSSEIEQKIWEIWSTHPTDQKLTKMLAQGSALMNSRMFKEAIIIFDQVIDLDSKWAEAWNKRATVFYLSGMYEDSIKDIEKVLQLEPRHFGALSGFGLNQIELKNFKMALKSYQKAQEIYPAIEAAKEMIPLIKELIAGQKI